ncbi:hypothetical protein D3C78_1969760 [compost metagenome]
MIAQATRNIASDEDSAITTSPEAITRPLLASTRRPPYRAIMRLVIGASRADTRIPSESAPNTH